MTINPSSNNYKKEGVFYTEKNGVTLYSAC